MAELNESLRLAEWLRQNSSGIYRPAAEAADLLTKQAERIVELEARVHTCGPTCSKAGCINRRITAERDTLRAEVERLRVDAAELRAALWHVKHVAKDIDAAKTIAGDAIDTARKATP